MVFRSLIFIAALAGGLGVAQFPAFSQQYVQRLGGAVTALGQVVADFDASAAGLGLTRAAALEQMQGTAFVEARRRDMERTLVRYERLGHDLAALEEGGPFSRALYVRRFGDAELVRGTWAAFEPAFPLGLASLSFACIGFFATLTGLSIIGRIARWKTRASAQSA